MSIFIQNIGKNPKNIKKKCAETNADEVDELVDPISYEQLGIREQNVFRVQSTDENTRSMRTTARGCLNEDTVQGLRKAPGSGTDTFLHPISREPVYFQKPSKKEIAHKKVQFLPGFYFFKARWCGYCKRASPIVDKLKEYPQHGQFVREISVGQEGEEINITPAQPVLEKKTYAELHTLFGITGYPTFFHITLTGEIVKYEKEQSVSAFMNTIAQQDYFKNAPPLLDDEPIKKTTTAVDPVFAFEAAKKPNAAKFLKLQVQMDSTLTPPTEGLYFFHLPWCGWCKKAKVHIDALEKSEMFGSRIHQINMESENPKLFMDMSAHEIQEKMKMDAFPKIIIYFGGKQFYNYTGPREVDSITSVLRELF